MKLEGVYTALVTPFTETGGIDEGALRKLVDFQIEAGISGLVPMGTTGESPTLSHEEHMHAIDIVIKQAKRRVPVIAGTGSNCTDEAIDMTKKAKDLGADASLQVANYESQRGDEGFYRHFMAIADAVDLPMIVYNIPGRCGKNIENPIMLKLAQHPNIIGVKEASGNIAQMMDLIAKKPKNFAVVSGDDNLTFPLVMLGGAGVISVASNIIPKAMEELVRESLKGNTAQAREMHYKLLPLFKNLFIETNPIPIKYALALKGMMKEVYRLPLCPMDDAKKAILKKTLEELNIL